MLLPALVSNKFNKWSNSFIVNNCVQAIIVIIALLLQLYSHSSGLLLTDDSHHYLAGSHSFKNSSVLVDDDGQYFLFWPPLFPIMLSFLASPGQSLIWINLAVEFCIALAVLNISNQIIQRSWIRILNFAFILLGVHILLISTFLWSELFFLLFAIVFIDQLPRSKKSKSSLYIAIAFGFLMCLQRNAGIFIATAGGIWIFISEISWRQKTLRTLLVFLSVASGVLVWNIYVWFILPHKHFSFSEELFQRLSSNVNSLSYAIINAFIPINFFSFILLIILFSSILFLLRVELKKNSTLQLIVLVTIIYLLCLYLIVIINIAGFPVDYGEADRFIAIVIPFLSMLFFKSFEILFERQSSLTKTLMIVLVIVWMGYPLLRTVKNAMHWRKVSINYNK